VDEAHCIERWGPEFRPSYLALGEVREVLGAPVCLAVTASASPRTVRRIAEVLRMRDPLMVRTSCLRPNLTLRATCCRDVREQNELVAGYVTASPGSGIVYARSRDGADSCAALLRRRGSVAESYHAHLDRADRSGIQRRFLTGETRVVVATVAFGMGIDKPDVRWVVHRGLPETMDAYYQEVGRAGRDGQAADCLLVWSPTDLDIHRALRRGTPSAERRDEAVLASAGMVRFAAGAGCRHAVVARHFGEVIARCADRCDVCRPDLTRLLAR
jgi:ATP-dependent DNA helicase RecQ